MYKKILNIFLLMLLMCFCAFKAYAKDDIILIIDGEKIETDVSPFISNDRTLVPVRCIFEKFKAEVNWVESTQQVIINSGETKITLQINNKTAYVNNEAVKLDSAPLIKNDRTFVPVRFISEKLGYNVSWNGDERVVSIFSPQKEETPKSTITKIEAVKSGSGSLVTIKADNFEKPLISTASSPTRYILDFSEAVLAGGDSKIRLNNNDITEVRYAGHDGYARVVIESPGKAEYKCSYYDGYMTIAVVGTVEAVTTPDSGNTPDSKNPVVVIDAGHGGWDTGAIGYDEEGNALLRECDVNLKIAKKVQYYLELKGISVVMTRQTDKALGDTEMDDLVNRSEVANNANATFFVSIHNNSFTDPSASGTMVLYADTENKKDYGVTSKKLAQNILTPLVETMQLMNRGVVDSPKMVVLKKTNMPSVLIECGFVSCPKDREILMNEERLEGIAAAIAVGIQNSIAQLP